jgi:hypothetical protein
MCDVTRRSRELLTGVNLWMLNILLSLNQWVYPLWELQMTTKHGGHLPGSNGVKENNSEHGAKRTTASMAQKMTVGFLIF